MSMDSKIFWQGETQLLGWSETNSRGRTVTLQLNEDEDVHPFKFVTTKSGKTAGRRFMCVFVEIGDDERPVEKTPSQMAFLVCKDKEFWEWANEQSFEQIDSEDTARAFVLDRCVIKSRGELDTEVTARALWENTIYLPFNAWRKAKYAV